MKRKLLIVLLTSFFFACNDEIKVNDKKLNGLDAAGAKLQKTVQKGADTVASKLKKLKNKLDEDRRDTLK